MNVDSANYELVHIHEAFVADVLLSFSFTFLFALF